MRWCVVVLATLCTMSAGPAAAQDADERAALAVVRTLFDGMREKDEAKLRSVWHEEARLQSAARDDAGAPSVTSTPIDRFVTGVLGSTRHLDEVTFDEVVSVDGDLASVWAPYNIFVDGDLSHCGVDAFQMVRGAEGWKILQLTDTRTREGCDASRRGG
jgi:hypothetical protein